jgi:hypothetical protein
MRTTKRLLILFGAGAALFLVAWLLLPWNPLPFSGDEVTQVGFHLRLIESEEDKLDCVTTKPETVGSLVRALGRARRSNFNHRCSWLGELGFRLRNGTTVHIEIRPGHSEQHYEYCLGPDLFYVERERFLAAMGDLGVPRGRLCRSSRT